MTRPLHPRDQLVLALIFGGLVAYLVYGAIVGDQFIPFKRSAGGLHLAGLWAWVVACGPAIMYLAVQVRHGFIEALGHRSRLALEMSLLALGVLAFFGGMRMGIEACRC